MKKALILTASAVAVGLVSYASVHLGAAIFDIAKDKMGGE